MKLINKIFVMFAKIRIGFLHATFQRNMRKANDARSKQDIVTFKKHIYQAEDAWRKIVILTQKIKVNG
jgi:hypothetical protein